MKTNRKILIFKILLQEQVDIKEMMQAEQIAQVVLGGSMKINVTAILQIIGVHKLLGAGKIIKTD
jgi:hypothetical protein